MRDGDRTSPTQFVVAGAFCAPLLPVLFFGPFAFRAAATAWVWGAFAAPLGLPAVGFWHAAGLLLLVALFRPTPARERDEDRRPWLDLVRNLLQTATVWLIALAVHAGL